MFAWNLFSTTMQDPVGYFKQEGMASFRHADFDDAILCFEKALQFASSTRNDYEGDDDSGSTTTVSELYHLIAYALSRKGDHVQAIEAYQRALEMKRQQPHDYGSCTTMSNPKQQISHDQAWVYYRMAKCYLQKGQPDEAREYLQRALVVFDEVMGSDHAVVKKIKRILNSLNNNGPPHSSLVGVSKNWNVKAPKVVSSSKKTKKKIASSPSPRPASCVRLGSGKLSAKDNSVALDVF